MMSGVVGESTILFWILAVRAGEFIIYQRRMSYLDFVLRNSIVLLLISYKINDHIKVYKRNVTVY